VSSTPRARTVTRVSEIAQIAARHGFGYLFETRPFTPFRRRESDDEQLSSRGQRLRDMFDELGPTFVKFGQLLSLRADVLPPDITQALRELQEHVTPFPYADVERVVRYDLGLSVEQLFLEFEEKPIAAASIGQVHRATLPNGRRVAVKVQRPDAPRQIEADIALMQQVARVIRDRVKRLSFIDPVALVDEFAGTIREELDYLREARNAERFARNFADSPRVRVPGVWRSYTTSRVLTLEYLDGTTLADLDYEALLMTRRRAIAVQSAETWMTMIFRHGFFHGDPHPANVMVVGDGIGLLDFGMVGRLSSEDLSKLTALFIDAVRRDTPALPRRLRAIGVHFPSELEDEFVHELDTLFDRYYGASLGDIDPVQLIREAFQLIFRMRLELPTRFVLVDRAIATLAAVGTELYPEFNVFEVAQPYARELLLERFSPRRLAARSRQDVGRYTRVVRELPFQLHDVLDEVRDGQVEVGVHVQALQQIVDTADQWVNRLVVAVAAGAGIIGSAVLAALGEHGWQNALSITGFVLSFLLGAWLAWGVIRSGRL
jgi:ubiquinone biosynthesis protein